MTPLERAARALYLLRDGPSEAMQAHLSADELAEEQAYADAEWRRYLPEVRAVLAAVRDPSEAMIGACDSIGLDEIKEDPRRGALFWQAMVDAGLAEEPT